MTIDTSGTWWVGTEPVDIDAYLGAYMEDSSTITEVVHAQCRCGAQEFRIDADGEQGCVMRTCFGCSTEHLVCDSAEFLEDSELERVVCPGGGERFNLAVGFGRRQDGSINWLAVGFLCVECGVLGSPADWKIDYAPSEHLVNQV